MTEHCTVGLLSSEIAKDLFGGPNIGLVPTLNGKHSPTSATARQHFPVYLPASIGKQVKAANRKRNFEAIPPPSQQFFPKQARN